MPSQQKRRRARRKGLRACTARYQKRARQAYNCVSSWFFCAYGSSATNATMMKTASCTNARSRDPVMVSLLRGFSQYLGRWSGVARVNRRCARVLLIPGCRQCGIKALI
eukprot:IDg1564t1